MKRIEGLSENDHFSAQKFWKEKNSIKSSIQSCNSVYDRNGKEVFEDEEIVEAYRDEFDNRLTSVQIKAPLQNFKQRTEELCEQIVRVASTKKQPDFTRDELDVVVNKMQQGKAHGPDRKPAEIYKHGGDSFRDLSLKVLNCIKNSHKTPEQWEMMRITPLYKGKGSRKHLVNQRGIFLTQVFCKIWERLIKQRIKGTTSKINKLQSGSQDNKSPSDPLFLLRSCISHTKYINSPLYVNFYDFKQCFDKIWLLDSIIALYKLGLDNEHLFHIYQTNCKARITVNTPRGSSEMFTKTEIVKQGSVSASSLCSASTGEFCDEHKEGGVQIGTTRINSLAYVDDLTTTNTNSSDASNSHEKVCFFSDKKKQPLNEDKCFLLPINLRQCDPIPTQIVNGKEVVVKEKAPYLGDIFNTRATYKDLILDRARKGTVCTIDSMSTCSTSEMGKFTINSLMLTYQAVFLQIMLFNSNTWDNIPQKYIDKLQSTQLKYLKWMLHTPRGTPNVLVFLEVGVLPIRYEIDMRKINYLHHILTIELDDPVRHAHQNQKLFKDEENWANEMKTILEMYNLPTDECVIQRMSKEKWKTTTNNAIYQHALTYMQQKHKEIKNTYVTNYTQLHQQDYFTYLSPQDARTCFQLKSGVYDIKYNRPYIYDDDVCRLCQNGIEDVFHILNVCTKVNRSGNVLNSISNLSEEETREMVKRINTFKMILELKEDEVMGTDEES